MIKKKILFTGPVSTRSGYGSRSRDFCRALISIGHDVSIIPTRWGNTPMDVLTDSDTDLVSRVITSPDKIGDIDIHIQCTIPNEFRGVEGAFNIGLTAGIETDSIPGEWIEGCNRMDLILVSSEHSKNVFLNTSYNKKDARTHNTIESVKVNVPVEVLFEGIDTNIFSVENDNFTTEDIPDLINGIDEDFLFLFVGTWLNGELGFDRKNIAGLIKAFLTEFSGDSEGDPALLLKVSMASYSKPEKYKILKNINEIRRIVREESGIPHLALPNIYLLYGDFSDDDMNYLYNHEKVKAMVSFTRGEGYGRPLLEFTTTGKPVIAPKWSGQLDFLHKKYNKFFGGRLYQIHPSVVNDWFTKDSKWFEVDHDNAKNLLGRVYYEHRKFIRGAKKQKGYTIGKFTINDMSDKIAEIINECTQVKTVKPLELPKKINK